MSKRRYQRGERCTSVDEAMAERIVYVGYWDNPRCVDFLNNMSYRTLKRFLDTCGIYKAVESDNPVRDRPEIKLEGQIDLFEE